MDNDEVIKQVDENDDDQALLTRRDFLAGLRKWSAAVIGVVVAGGVLLPGENASGWVNGRGGWVNAAVGWVNRSTAWVNGGGGGSWVNRSGGGGAGWVNRSGGGGSWVNRRGW